MNAMQLTKPAARAHKPRMTGARRAALGAARMLVLAGTATLGGCITLEAPDEPIVIELNINITQEVIYRLAEDAGNTLDENAGIF
jgi:cell division septal protein FtsQ